MYCSFSYFDVPTLGPVVTELQPVPPPQNVHKHSIRQANFCPQMHHLAWLSKQAARFRLLRLPHVPTAAAAPLPPPTAPPSFSPPLTPCAPSPTRQRRHIHLLQLLAFVVLLWHITPFTPCTSQSHHASCSTRRPLGYTLRGTPFTSSEGITGGGSAAAPPQHLHFNFDFHSRHRSFSSTMRAQLLVLLACPAVAIDNGLGLLPPMGWRNWWSMFGNVNQERMENAMARTQWCSL